MPASATSERVYPVDVVAIVASAGGIAAVSQVLGQLPAEFPVPIVYAQHLGPRPSRLAVILRRHTELPVEWAAQGCLAAPSLVTLCPPRTRLNVRPDLSCLLRPAERTAADHPLDALLASVADSFRARALAVVLSGAGRDGATGAHAVHEAGGLVLAQDEETAEHPWLPRAVVKARAADRVLPVGVLGHAIAGFVTGDVLPPSPADAAAEPAGRRIGRFRH